jgi:hypothetical protein
MENAVPIVIVLGSEVLENSLMETDKKVILDNTTVDYVASAARAALSVVPFAGSLLAEIAGVVIPNQRIDRIADLAARLEQKFAAMDKDLIRSKLTDENFTDLMEEALRQAARAVTEERREHISNLLANSLKSDDISFVESKHLLRILGELNDLEIIWLAFHGIGSFEARTAFVQKHQDVVRPETNQGRPSQRDFDKWALEASYKEHLAGLNLLERHYATNIQSREPEFDTLTGGLRVRDYRLTQLGELLLRQIKSGEEIRTPGLAP